jgi:hypothetical protein
MTVRLGRGEDIYELLKVASLNGLLGEYSGAVESTETSANVGFPHGASGADIWIPAIHFETGAASSPHSIGGADVWIPPHWLEFSTVSSPHAPSGADVYTQSPIVAGSVSSPHSISGADVYHARADMLVVIEADGAPEVIDVKRIVFDNGTVTDNGNGVARVTNSGGGTDANAIHVNVSAEISGIEEKTTPVSNDLLVIEDSEATYAKKSVSIGNLLATSTSTSGVSVVAGVNLTGQNDDIAETNFNDTDTIGMYRVSSFLMTTKADAGAGGAELVFYWNDGKNNESFSPAAINLAIDGDYETNIGGIVPIVIYSGSGSISYEVTHTGSYGTAEYDLHIRVERLSIVSTTYTETGQGVGALSASGEDVYYNE